MVRGSRGLAPKERRPLARAVPFHSAWTERRQRGAARARRKRPCVASYQERASERRRAQARYTRKPPRPMRGRADTWEQGPGADGTAASRSCSALS